MKTEKIKSKEIKLGEVKQRAQEFFDSGSASAKVTKVMFAIAAVGGLMFVGAVAPNLVQLLNCRYKTKRHSSKQIYNAYRYLKRHGFIETKVNKQGKTVIFLTRAGEKKLDDFDLDNIVIPTPAKWDGKWRVLMFDLPVRFNKAREALRWKIKDLGFWQLQKSVWIYPYPCVEELLFVAEFFGVTKYVEILTVEKVLREEELKKHFGLK